MKVITNTNIIVDNFEYCKNYTKGTFIHFLTHFHAGHYKGLTSEWNYGIIYCSEITKNLILANFPKLANQTQIISQDLNVKFDVPLDKEKTKSVSATFFDANHIPGSVMILFEGYMGTILHTGDMRFSESMLIDNTILYPVEKRNKQNYKCSIHIDELIFDSTYINPIHQFPTRQKALNKLIKLIETNKDKYIIISMSILGKEQIAVDLSDHFKTKILVPEKKLEMMKIMKLPTNMMTTIQSPQIWIEITHEHLREARLELEMKEQKKNFIMVSLEFTEYQGEYLKASNGTSSLIPYSQHSNCNELEKFIKSVCPSILRKRSLPYMKKPQFKHQPIDNLKQYNEYIASLAKGGKSIFAHFLKSYTNIRQLSDRYKSWMTPESQNQLLIELKIPLARVVTEKKFPAQISKNKKRKFLDNMSHKIAVNNNQNLHILFSKIQTKNILPPHSQTPPSNLKTDFQSDEELLFFLQKFINSK